MFTIALTFSLIAGPANATTCGCEEYQDGTTGPAVCPNGDANENVRPRYAKTTPAIMSLSKTANRPQLNRAIGADGKRQATGVALYDAIEFQAAHYDWSRSLVHPANRGVVLGNFYC